MSSTPSGTDRTTINSATGSQPAAQSSARGGIFKDFSGVTVIASTLASCTSFLLSNSIGIAGSLIGALVGGLASAAGLQIYKAILIQTGDKFREVTEERRGGLTQQSAPVDAGTPAEAEATQADATQTLDASGEGWQPTSVSGQATVEATSATGTPIAPDAVAEAAHDRERRRHQRRLIVIMVVAALVAVLVTAGIITLVTQGEGIGPTADEVVEEIEVALEATESSEDADEEGSEDDAAASDDAATDASDNAEDGTDEDDTASATGEGDASADASADDTTGTDTTGIDATDTDASGSEGSDATSSDAAETQTDEGTGDTSASDAATTTSETAE